MPPVTRTVPSGSIACGTVSTTLPTWRAWLTNASASEPRRTSNAVTRRERELPALERRDGLADELAEPLRPGPEQVDARVAHPGMRRGDGVGVADVGHPELEEPPAARS